MTNIELAVELRRLIDLRGTMQSVQARVNISEEIGDLMDEHSAQIIAALESCDEGRPMGDKSVRITAHRGDGGSMFIDGIVKDSTGGKR